MKVQFLASLVAAVALTGCSYNTNAVRSEPSYQDASANTFLATNQEAALKLIAGFAPETFQDRPLLVATIVDVNDTRVSAPLGRTLSEQYSSALANAGLNVREIKLRGDVFVQEGTGELLLSREVQNVAKSQNSSLVLVGTYSAASRLTYISLKLVRTEDSRIISAYDYALPNNRDIRRLLQSQ